MRRFSPGLCLAATLVVYIFLWMLIPKATFIPSALSAIARAMAGAHGLRAIWLGAIGAIIIAVPTVLIMACQVAIIYYYAMLRTDFRRSLAVLIVALAALVGVINLIIIQYGVSAKLGHYPNILEQLQIMGMYFGPLKIVFSLLVVFAVASIGCMVALRVKDRNLLLPVVMFAAFIDLWTCNMGPVSTFVKNAPTVAYAVSAPIPKAGAGSFVPATFIGPGDFLFMALVFAAIFRLGLNGKRNFWAVFIAMTAGMLAVAFDLIQFLPALTVLAVAVVVANWKQFKLTRQEGISIAIVGLVLAALLPLLWHAFRPKEKPAEPKKITAPKKSPGQR